MNVRWKRCVARAVSIGRAMARFLGTSSPKIMVSAGAEGQGEATASGCTAPSGTPSASSGAVDQLGDRRLGQEADGQVGDGDPDLGAGELGGQRAQRRLDARGAGVTGGGGLVDLRPVDGDEGELRGDEDAARRDEEQRGPAQQEPLGHRVAPGEACGDGRAGAL